ncbi:hypothetical protein [Faecalicatena contorta]|uniref:hypothetical protein n=1 Tax=Faecalicatena contorta TaxID=39482 RepID=UPI000AD05769|nr:hypothetical protein [Faecalicatena contorta]
MTCVRCDTLADPEKSVTGKPMNCQSLETRVFGLWSGVVASGQVIIPFLQMQE